MATAPNVATGEGRIPAAKPKKPKTSKPHTTGTNGGTTAPAGRYQWNGLGHHTISYGQHMANVATRNALGDTTDLTQPVTPQQAVREATAAADLQYGPQIQAAQQLQTNLPTWYSDYLARVAGYAKAAQGFAQPVINQASTAKTNENAAIPAGLDPNSPAGQAAAQAAAGRASLDQLGLDALNANNTATQDYFGAQQSTAQRELPQAQTAAAQALANAKTQRGAAVTAALNSERQNAQNYAIARGTLGLNAVKESDAVTAASDAAKAKSKADDNTVITSGPFAGMTHKQVRDLDPTASAQIRDAAKAPEKIMTSGPFAGMTQSQLGRHSQSFIQHKIDVYNEGKGKGSTEKDAQKHVNDVHTATGKVQNTITDIIGKWDGYVGKTTDDTTKPKDPKTGQYPPRKLTSDDIRALLQSQNKNWTPQLIHIALLRRVGKPLDQASIDYLHQMDPNIRIPRDWLKPQPKSSDPGYTPPLTNDPFGRTFPDPLAGK